MFISIQRRAVFHGHVAIAALLLSAALAPSASFSQTLPSDAVVTDGDARVMSRSFRMDVHQSSPTAVISWEDFSVGNGGEVHFNNGNGATLNRVRGNLASQIDGTVTATGSLYLVNPNGVAVGPNGVVETGGSFVASTLGLSDEEFAKAARGESYTLEGGSTARVVNAGKIGALGGDVVLVAREVENDGDIEAPTGAVGLLAGNEVLIKDRNSHDGRFLVKSRSADTKVRNSGNIRAVEAELRANGGNVYALAGNRGGIVTATGSATRNGRIFLTADEGWGVDRGRVEVTGTLNARQPSRRAGAAFDGGEIRIQARGVRIAGKLNAHGSVAAANPEMLPPPRPDDALLNGDGGFVMVSARAPESDVSAASVNVAGVTPGMVRFALEDAPPPGPIVIPPPVVVPTPEPEAPPPPVEEPTPEPEAPPPPVDEPTPEPEAPPPPVEEPAPEPEAPRPPVEKPAPKPETPRPPVKPAPEPVAPPPPVEEPAPKPEAPLPPVKPVPEPEAPAPADEAPAPPAEEAAPAPSAPQPPVEEEKSQPASPAGRPAAPAPARGECTGTDPSAPQALETICEVDRQHTGSENAR